MKLVEELDKDFKIVVTQLIYAAILLPQQKKKIDNYWAVFRSALKKNNYFLRPEVNIMSLALFLFLFF